MKDLRNIFGSKRSISKVKSSSIVIPSNLNSVTASTSLPKRSIKEGLYIRAFVFLTKLLFLEGNETSVQIYVSY